jgi:hypothetical protein
MTGMGARKMVSFVHELELTCDMKYFLTVMRLEKVNTSFTQRLGDGDGICWKVDGCGVGQTHALKLTATGPCLVPCTDDVLIKFSMPREYHFLFRNKYLFICQPPQTCQSSTLINNIQSIAKWLISIRSYVPQIPMCIESDVIPAPKRQSSRRSMHFFPCDPSTIISPSGLLTLAEQS